MSIAYVLVGIGVAEAAQIFFPALGLGESASRLVAIIVILGFPLAMVLAWAFDVVPDRPSSGRTFSQSATPDSPVDWERIKELFITALESPDDEREAFLVRMEEEDPPVAKRLRALLRSHDGDGPLDSLQDRVMGPSADGMRSSANLVGQTVLHYQVEEKLDGGGMGVVYRAQDARLGRAVALKFLSTHLLSDSAARERFLIEARAAATLDHPNLCTIHEVGETTDGHLFIAMAFYEGQSLKQRIARGPIGVPEAMEIIAQVARGLACAAEAGIVHRDIKPGNLILTDEGTVKIVDFGLAKVVGGELTKTGARMGTVSYMSPEQTRGEVVDQRTDIWSVGVVLYEMLSGRRPFRGGGDQAVIHAILNEVPIPLDELVPGVATGVQRLVERALKKDPAHRFGDAASLLRDVERLLADPDYSGSGAPVPALPTEGERRLVTVLSCAISGYEALLDTCAPDVAEETLGRLRNRIRGLVEDYGGVLNAFSEERAVALFGVPLTHEDDALRAVRAALEVQQDLAKGSLGKGLLLGAAIGSGYVAIRATDSVAHPFRLGGTVVRDTSLLGATAASGEVLISPHLSRSLEHLLETEARPPVVLAPGQAPTEPLAVLGEAETDSIMDASLPGGLSRFVGREREMDVLTRALTNAASGQGNLVSIVGEAGLGKSRLLHELRSLLAEEGIRYLQGRCHSYGSLTPFVPLVESLRSLLGLGRSTPEEAHDLVVQRIRGLGSELNVYLPILLHMLSIESDEFPLPDLTDDEFRSASTGALVSVFTLGARVQPLVLLLEDWHWSDGGSQEVLEALGEMAPSHALLIVVTSRPRMGSTTPDGSRIVLAPLDDHAATSLIRSALRGARVSDELSGEVWEKSGGNPFFLEELCHTLLESRTVVIEGGEAKVAGPLNGLDIPDTVQAVLRSRLDRLDPEAREVLRCASVVGRQFGLTLLGRIVPSPSRLEGALNTLRALGFIQRTKMVPELTHRFNHALTRDVTYDSLLERQRKERHEAVGEAIEAVHGSQLDSFLDRLTGHFATAERWDKAIAYGLAAAERSAGLWQYKEAVKTLDRTRQWIESGPESLADQQATMISLLLDQERHLERLGDRGRQLSVIDDLLALVPETPSPQRATVLARQGECHTLSERYEAAETSFAAAIEVAEACGALHERSLALRGLGLRFWRAGLYAEAVPPLTRLVGYSREYASPSVLIRDLMNLGRVYKELGRWEDAWGLLNEAHAIEHEAGPLDRGYVYNFRAHLLRAGGQPEEALQAFKRADEEHASTSLGRLVPVRISIHTLSSAALHLEMGLIDEALALYQESTDLARRGNRADHLAHALTLHADALTSLGRPELASPLYEDAVETLQRLGTRRLLSQTLGKLAEAREAAGMPEAAEAWDLAKRLRLDLGERVGALLATEHQARVTEGSGDQKTALLSDALTQAATLSDSVAIARIRNQLALVAWRQNDFPSAVEHFERGTKALEDSGEDEGRGIILNGWGAALSGVGRHEEAKSVLMDALVVNQRTEDAAREADTWAALGACYRSSGDSARAYQAYEQCAERRQAAGDPVGAGWALARLAGLAGTVATPDAARAFAQEAVSIARLARDDALLALCEPLARTTDGTLSS